MACHPITQVIRRWLTKPGVQPKRPHPAIFRIEPRRGSCAVCEEVKRLCYVDRESGDVFCSSCLGYVEWADEVLADQLARPVPVL